jgi:AraC family transcriptional regulator of adaptative response/methylated-DNA-[protein]-cysteine methyltransferase
MNIRYTVTSNGLGRLLLAATDRGVCAVKLGASDRTLEADLFRQYPDARIERDDVKLRPWVKQLADHLNGRRPVIDLPVDLFSGTPFQRRVWRELQAIPYGSTRSYSEIAKQIGKPRAARAVGRACATNPVAIIIPCHRVVRNDGGLGGFGLGVKVKEKLLAKEREVATA